MDFSKTGIGKLYADLLKRERWKNDTSARCSKINQGNYITHSVW